MRLLLTWIPEKRSEGSWKKENQEEEVGGDDREVSDNLSSVGNGFGMSNEENKEVYLSHSFPRDSL